MKIQSILGKRKYIVGLALSAALNLVPVDAWASEYCVDKYQGQIEKVNSELGSIVRRQAYIDERLGVLFKEIIELTSQISAAASQSPPDTAEISRLSLMLQPKQRERVELEAESYKNMDRVNALKGVIPADLQGELRGCVEATAPANKLVNTAIQVVALLSTGGASVTLPPKALYVDMSAVLNGYPTGGSSSVINQSREAALNALGIGGQNNDIGRAVKDPVNEVRRVVCGLFRC